MNTSSSSAVYNDLGGLASLKARSNGGDEKGALKVAAKQFEAIFLNMMLKQMREASFGDPLFDSDAGDSYRSMFDQQLALNLSENGSLGIAKLIERQLGGKPSSDSGDSSDNNPFKSFRFLAPQLNNNTKSIVPKSFSLSSISNISSASGKSAQFTSPNDFVEKIWPHAETAAKELGIPTETLVSQAALETGWGKFVMSNAEGKPSYNLFGIKADSRWDGEQVSVQTTEYRDGVVEKERANFRAYDSLEQGFNDYVQFIKTSPRYGDALNSRGDAVSYLNNLQQGGYATDPAYANKIQGIMSGETLHAARTKLNSLTGVQVQ
ncbi:MAG: flagellar assembly peptidoglycan hydrolase FlgJ [Sulfuriflexus sp.]|nr:flagellar assembly peptidoglycan hydrolase FlgJ [Sulfuriflexus sp.]